VTLLPDWLVTLLLIGLPLAVAIFFGRSALRPPPPMLYLCLRCDHAFRDDAHHGYPDRCPRCAAADWNTAPSTPR
jgi:hypothetical protein